ncbi:facilitated trehalose transporter Tret1-like [Procambarus clarkii]|uniref:facilitated trehalose transporter Tret1-like n=1 Tax=Procambarus clarkii TaxID=6728 RepID=UPI0037421E2B
MGSVVGCCISGPLMMYLGPRIYLLVSLVISVASWLLQAFSPSVGVLLTSRVLLGLTLGSISNSSGLYVLEISHQDIRGALSGIMFLVRQLGYLLASVVGLSSLGWRQMGFVYSGTTAIPILGLIFLPNSPRWLVTRGRVTDAQKALVFFRGKHYDFQLELKAIADIYCSSGGGNVIWQQLRGIAKSSVFRIFCLMASLNFMMGFDGNVSMTSYLVPIFKKLNTNLDSYTSSIIFNGIKIVGALLCFCVTDRLGRRPVVIAPYCVCAVCLAVCGGYFYMQESDSLKWLQLSSVFVYILFNSIGQPIITILSGELMPASFRAIGFSMLNLVAVLGMFAASMTYPATVEALGQHGAFWLFSAVCGTLALVSALTLPETLGRSLEDIEAVTRCQTVEA